jgi:hypothetical protein
MNLLMFLAYCCMLGDDDGGAIKCMLRFRWTAHVA